MLGHGGGPERRGRVRPPFLRIFPPAPNIPRPRPPYCAVAGNSSLRDPRVHDPRAPAILGIFGHSCRLGCTGAGGATYVVRYLSRSAHSGRLGADRIAQRRGRRHGSSDIRVGGGPSAPDSQPWEGQCGRLDVDEERMRPSAPDSQQGRIRLRLSGSAAIRTSKGGAEVARCRGEGGGASGFETGAP